MNKFMVHNQDEAEIEIARAFDRPMVCMLSRYASVLHQRLHDLIFSRPLIMILEDRGVHRDAFMKLQNAAKAEVMTSGKDLAQYRSMLVNHSLGSSYRLPYIAENLMKLTLDLRSTPNAGNLEYGFFRRLGHYAMSVFVVLSWETTHVRPLSHHSLREIKHNSRIPIDGWLLPGIADEGPRYQAEGERDVEVLGSEEIYGKLVQHHVTICTHQSQTVCVQGPDDEAPRWIRGRCSIWRAPTVSVSPWSHVIALRMPGGRFIRVMVCCSTSSRFPALTCCLFVVQQVYAIGKPPAGKLCSFRNLKNVVVLPSMGGMIWDSEMFPFLMIW
jgi:RNA-dependent RNA polymerase